MAQHTVHPSRASGSLAFRAFTLLCAAWLLGGAMDTQGGDWPRWRGPNLNGISDETDWTDQWPPTGPSVIWKAAVGTGFSAVTISQGRLFTMGNAHDQDTVFCFDAVSGKPLWKHTYAAPLDDKYFDGGPTATPTVDGESVFTLGRRGALFCFDAATGKVRWSKNVAEELGQPRPSWGFASSPFVHGNLLLLNVGEAGTAVDKATGKVVWTSARKDAGYSTPVPLRAGAESAVVLGSDNCIVAVKPETGKELWRHRWTTRYGVNAADAIVAGDQVFFSSGYNEGAVLLKAGAAQPAVLWQNKNLRTQLNAVVLLEDFLYGFDGDSNSRAKLRCVELKSGAVKWTLEDTGFGSLSAANGKLIVLTDKGLLMVAKASPEGFKPTARAKVIGGKCWTVPVLANGRLYCRNAAGDLVCLDLRATK